jgi:hypothetical protein
MLKELDPTLENAVPKVESITHFAQEEELPPMPIPKMAYTLTAIAPARLTVFASAVVLPSLSVSHIREQRFYK